MGSGKINLLLLPIIDSPILSTFAKEEKLRYTETTS